MPRSRSVGVVAVLLSTPKPCIQTHGFLHSVNNRVAIVARRANQKLAAVEEGTKTYEESFRRWKHEPFDFSSKFGWDDFYKQGIEHTDFSTPATFEDGQILCEAIESLEYEWHPHIHCSVIVDAVKPMISLASENYSQLHSTSTEPIYLPSILLIGCGNSALPRKLHDAFDTPVRVTCLDYSPVCIEMIKSMYGPSYPNMDFVTGDATRLQEVVWNADDGNQSFGGRHFDVIVDKGLLDALMCNEGFDIASLMDGINNVLTLNEWGVHVLVCFPLSKVLKQSLVELGRSGNGSSLVWDFDIPVEGNENGRGCLNLARRCRQQDARELGIGRITNKESPLV